MCRGNMGGPSHLQVVSKTKPDKRKGRRDSYLRFSPAEHAMLLEGVHHFGAGNWKKILSSYQFHFKRTAVDLKDKYRNILRAKEREKSIREHQKFPLENRLDHASLSKFPLPPTNPAAKSSAFVHRFSQPKPKPVLKYPCLLPPLTMVLNSSSFETDVLKRDTCCPNLPALKWEKSTTFRPLVNHHLAHPIPVPVTSLRSLPALSSNSRRIQEQVCTTTCNTTDPIKKVRAPSPMKLDRLLCHPETIYTSKA